MKLIICPPDRPPGAPKAQCGLGRKSGPVVRMHASMEILMYDLVAAAE